MADLGEAPSPGTAAAEVHGEPTSHLVPMERSIPMPPAIIGGSTVRVSDTLTFRIQRGPSTITPGPSVVVNDVVKLGSTFTRLGRAIPHFHQGAPIVVQHPLKMSNHKYLKSMAPGQEAIFHWTVCQFSSPLTVDGKY